MKLLQNFLFETKAGASGWRWRPDRMGQLLLGIFLLFTLSNSLRASNIEDDYLKGVSGARAIGLGGAFGALADTPDGAAWNPAGLGLLSSDVGLTGHWSNYWGETNIYGLSCSVPALIGVAGINYLQEKTNDIWQTIEDENGRPEIEGSFYNAKTVINFSYSFEVFRNIYWGTNVKFYNHTIATTMAKGYGADVGFLYRGIGVENPFLPANVGLTIYNALSPRLSWPSGSSDSFERHYSVSLAYPLAWENNSVNLNLEIENLAGKFIIKAGAEYWPLDILAGRIGLNENGFTLGVGLKIQEKLTLDIAYFNNPDLGANYQLSLSWFFSKMEWGQGTAPKESEKETTPILIEQY